MNARLAWFPFALGVLMLVGIVVVAAGTIAAVIEGHLLVALLALVPLDALIAVSTVAYWRMLLAVRS